MEILLFVVLLAGAYWVLRWRSKRRNEALRYLTFMGIATNGHMARWRYDFVQMVAWTPAGGAGPVRHDVRRSNDASWQIRLTRDSANEQAARLRAAVTSRSAEALAWGSQIQERLRFLEQGPQWEIVDASVSAMLESQYQRFLRHYRD